MYETISIQMRNLRQEPIVFNIAGVQFSGDFLIVSNYTLDKVYIPTQSNLFRMNDVKTITYGTNL